VKCAELYVEDGSLTKLNAVSTKITEKYYIFAAANFMHITSQTDIHTLSTRFLRIFHHQREDDKLPVKKKQVMHP